MHKLNSNTENLLKKLATLLPVVNVHSAELHMHKGHEIISWGTITEIDGRPIQPEKIYQYKYPVITRANHYRRLKRAFKKGGVHGVQNYLQFITALTKSKAMHNQMEAIKMLFKTIHQNK